MWKVIVLTWIAAVVVICSALEVSAENTVNPIAKLPTDKDDKDDPMFNKAHALVKFPAMIVKVIWKINDFFVINPLGRTIFYFVAGIIGALTGGGFALFLGSLLGVGVYFGVSQSPFKLRFGDRQTYDRADIISQNPPMSVQPWMIRSPKKLVGNILSKPGDRSSDQFLMESKSLQEAYSKEDRNIDGQSQSDNYFSQVDSPSTNEHSHQDGADPTPKAEDRMAVSPVRRLPRNARFDFPEAFRNKLGRRRF